MKTSWIIFIFVNCLDLSLQRSTIVDDSYVAAVLEYAFDRNYSINLQNYLGYIKDASLQNADIVVFPELTLAASATEIPINGDLRFNPIPYKSPSLYSSVLVELSQAASDNEIYVVVNVEEIVDCVYNKQSELCPDNKIYYFNTNVVFDRTGAIIDRYRKINLFGEYSRTPALTPDLGVFFTDFGVRFGHFICFDLMFQVPAVQIVQKLNLTDIIFTTMWFSELPYLTAVQIQQAYAYALDVNMIASGANNVLVGSAGSGIYSGKAGAIVSTMPGVPTSTLLIAKVPKVPGQVESLTTSPANNEVENTADSGQIAALPSEADGLLLIKDPSITAHVSRLLENGYQQFVLSDKDVRCLFRVNISYGSADDSPKLRAVVRDGSNSYLHRQAGVVTCALISCKNDLIQSCPYRYHPNKNTAVEYLDIKMLSYSIQYNTTLQCDNIFYTPTTLTTDYLSLNPKEFSFTSKAKNGKQNLVFSLKRKTSNLITFGIWGRIFTRDVMKNNHEVTKEQLKQYADFEKMIFGYTNVVV